MVLHRTREHELLDLVGDFYDCAIDPKGWPAALQKMTMLVDGSQAVISLIDPTSNRVSVRATWNADPAFEAAMKANIATNPLIPCVWYNEVDQPFSAFAELGEDTFRDSKWFRQAAAPYDIGDGALLFLAKSVRQFAPLSIFRRASQAGFGEDELGTLRALAPHIRRAVMIADLLDARALERDMLSSTLEMLTVGVVLTDASARIVHANASALRHLDEGTALRRFGDELSARDPRCGRDLRQAIETAASGSAVNIQKHGISVVLKAVEGRDLAAWVLPLDSGLRRDLGSTFASRVAVFIRELGVTSPFPAELFVRHYGITPAESRVMMLTIQGMPMKDVADMLGIAPATAKTHLIRLFNKTGTRRQADFVRLAMSALAPASS